MHGSKMAAARQQGVGDRETGLLGDFAVGVIAGRSHRNQADAVADGAAPD
jgi:hypothetical protein